MEMPSRPCRAADPVEYDDVYNALQFAAVAGHRDVLMALLEATPFAKGLRP